MYLTPDTPPGCTDAVDLDSGTWWRLRALLQSDLIAEGISPMVQAVSLRDSNLPPSPDDQHRNALLSERLLAASVAAASPIPAPLWSAWRTLRAELDAVNRSVAALQAQADKGVDVGPALAEARARGGPPPRAGGRPRCRCRPRGPGPVEGAQGHPRPGHHRRRGSALRRPPRLGAGGHRPGHERPPGGHRGAPALVSRRMTCASSTDSADGTGSVPRRGCRALTRRLPCRSTSPAWPRGRPTSPRC